MRKALLSFLAVSATCSNAFTSLPQNRAFTATSSKSSLSMADLPVRKLGIFGGGTVGGGIVEIIQKKQDYFKELTGHGIEVAKICVRDASKKRDFDVPSGCIVTENYDDILDDDSIDMVVEVMGGTTDAKDVVFKALSKGKDVVTANKALIAKDLPEIEEKLEQCPGAEFRYEAAVCGGIPIIRSMQSDFPGDDIDMLSGIINGCTNFMLTSMDKGGKSYDEALAEASALGYAEADPTLDVGGFDARSKLRILMRLAFGIDVDEEDIACRGITELSKLDFDYAKMMGGTIKLVGVAKKVDEESVAAFVSPCYVTSDDSLSSVNGATNAVEVISSNLQSSTYIGQGAGRYPTANSCINDIVALAKGDKAPMPFNPFGKGKKFVNSYDSVFYIRLSYTDALGITRQCGEICEKHGVSIHSILQNPVTSKTDAAFVLVTEKVPLDSVKKAASDFEELDWCNGPVFYMPVLREDWVEAMSV
ncbi:Homoserine dehydrogenase [Seminavis robusta]|uniref:Homoserine dehydrogenase n=1 Tax=Seminavis robusta TaxID=568900 RepID=A0A9N8DZ54_9STRA|nr:Homoserine dehydrogenase [Seminavis robusta]|eukprot:Sro357_g125510.1 Homoserine dehydrogenase (477) ;mRNA; f:6268-7872